MSLPYNKPSPFT